MKTGKMENGKIAVVLSLSYLLSYLLVCPTIMAGEGKGGATGAGGGGDTYAAQFAGVGSRIDRAYKTVCSNPDNSTTVACQTLAAFSQAVQSAHILPRQDLSGTDGQPREAGPDGNGNILLNTTLYKIRLLESDASKSQVRLVAHEYMIIAKQESEDQYTASGPMLDLLKAYLIDFSALLGPIPQTTWTFSSEYDATDDSYISWACEMAEAAARNRVIRECGAQGMKICDISISTTKFNGGRTPTCTIKATGTGLVDLPVRHIFKVQERTHRRSVLSSPSSDRAVNDCYTAGYTSCKILHTYNSGSDDSKGHISNAIVEGNLN